MKLYNTLLSFCSLQTGDMVPCSIILADLFTYFSHMTPYPCLNVTVFQFESVCFVMKWVIYTQCCCCCLQVFDGDQSLGSSVPSWHFYKDKWTKLIILGYGHHSYSSMWENWDVLMQNRVLFRTYIENVTKCFYNTERSWMNWEWDR